MRVQVLDNQTFNKGGNVAALRAEVVASSNANKIDTKSMSFEKYAKTAEDKLDLKEMKVSFKLNPLVFPMM
jgi:hypothetical protein